MTRFSTLSLLLLTTGWAAAQSVTGLTGSVRDAKNQPASFAVVKLLRAADSTLAKGTLADEAGQYVFTEVGAGTYRVQVSLVGMTNATSQLVSVQGGQPLVLEPLVLNAA